MNEMNKPEGAPPEGPAPESAPPGTEDAGTGKLGRWVMFGCLCLLAAGAGLGIRYYVESAVSQAPQPVAQSGAQTTTQPARIGGPFEMSDHLGNAVTDADFRGKHMLVFFGYTYCPDVCPVVLNEVAAALDQLGDKAKDVQPLFVTVDPDRDTVSLLKEYMEHFPGVTGLTGTPEQVAQIAKAYRVYYAKVPAEEGGSIEEDYLVDHSALLFLMDEQGGFKGHFTHQVDADALARQLTSLLDS